MKPMYKRYAEQPERMIGGLFFTNTFGVLIYEPDEHDKYDCDLIACWAGLDTESWGFHRHKVHYTSTGRAYIRKGSIRIYLDEVMRI